MPTVSELMSQNIINSITNSQTWNGLLYAAKAYSLKGDGTTDDYTALNALISTTINGAEATIAIYGGDYVIGTSITIPSNVTLMFFNGGTLKPSTGITITVNGAVLAGLYQIFTGSGTIAGSMKVDKMYPQWWGASGEGDTTTTGGIASGLKALTVASISTFAEGQGISIAGAGAAGVALVTTIASISGLVVTLAVAASTTVIGAVVSHDDSAAFDTSFDNAITSLAKVVIPAGTYILSTGFDFSLYANATGIYIEGAGSTNTILKYTGVGGELFRFGKRTNAKTNLGCIKNLKLTTNSNPGASSGSNSTATAITIDNCSVPIDMSGLWITNFDVGLNFTWGYGHQPRDNYFTFCNKAIVWGAATTTCSMTNNVLERNVVGVYLAQVQDISIFNNVIQASYGGGDIQLYNNNDTVIIRGNYFEASPYCIRTIGDSGGAFQNRFIGIYENYLGADTTAGTGYCIILGNYVEHVVIRDNTFNNYDFAIYNNYAFQDGARRVIESENKYKNTTGTGVVKGGGQAANIISSYPISSGFRVYKSGSNQAVSASTSTKVTFETEEYDFLGEFAASRFTAVNAGIYIFAFGVAFNSLTINTLVTMDLFLNGGLKDRCYANTIAVAGFLNATGSAILNLAAGDYIEVYANTSNASTIVFSQASTFFEMTKLN